MDQKRQKQLLLSIAGFAVMSASFLLMPLELGILPGLLFWGGMLLGCLCQWTLRPKERVSIKKWGVFTFFSSKMGRMIDVSMILFTAAAAAVLTFDGYGYICYVLLAAAAFTFSLHCIVNSQNFAGIADTFKKRLKAENSGSNMKKGGPKSR